VAVWFFTANDGATTSGPPVAAPGVATTVPPQYAGDVRRGNVVLEVRTTAGAPAARGLAAALGDGAKDPALRAAGQAVLLAGPAGSPSGVAEPEIVCTAPPCPQVAAYAEGRRLTVASAADPRLRAFVEYWLGRAAG
jgi:hypothetical protein